MNLEQTGRPARILLVEDNENDVLLTREGFKQSKFLVDLDHVENGEECLAYLRKEGRFADAPTPDLVLLDLNMPRMNGREVMQRMVEDPRLRRIPVVVLTTSSGEEDVIEMYDLRCSSYITKPVDFEQFQRVISEFAEYWLTIVVLPPPPE